MNKKQQKAIEALALVKEWRTKLRSHQIIANSPLPKHKQRTHDLLVAQCIMYHRNAQTDYNKAVSKLSPAEQFGLGLELV